MYRFAEIRIVGLYLWGEDSIMGPQFEIKAGYNAKPTLLAESLDEHFGHLWNNAARPVTMDEGKLVIKRLREAEGEMIEEEEVIEEIEY